jgi:hypothetical protein
MGRCTAGLWTGRGDRYHRNDDRSVLPSALRIAVYLDQGRITDTMVGYTRFLFRVNPNVGREPYKAQADE